MPSRSLHHLFLSTTEEQPLCSFLKPKPVEADHLSHAAILIEEQIFHVSIVLDALNQE